ncbi:unnamed protein product, partial [Linum tenue]
FLFNLFFKRGHPYVKFLGRPLHPTNVQNKQVHHHHVHKNNLFSRRRRQKEPIGSPIGLATTRPNSRTTWTSLPPERVEGGGCLCRRWSPIASGGGSRTPSGMPTPATLRSKCLSARCIALAMVFLKMS